MTMRKMVIEQMDEMMVAVLKRKTPKERILMVSDMSEFLRSSLRIVLRQQHPEWTTAQIQQEVMRRCLNEHC